MTDIFKDATRVGSIFPMKLEAIRAYRNDDTRWQVCPKHPDGSHYAQITGHLSKEQARLIATAVNAYEPMLEALLDAFAILDNVEEINPSNYDHNLVCALNASAFDAWEVIKTAIHKLRKDGLIQLEEVQE